MSGDSTSEIIALRGRHGAWLLVRESCAQAVARALEARAGCAPVSGEGRGTVWRFPLPDGSEGILRECRRGGAVSLLLRRGYLLVNRPYREWQVHCRAWGAGVPTVEPLGVRWVWRGPLCFGALATRRAEGVSLARWLETHGNSKARAECLRTAGAAVRRVHDAGLLHADLQIRNFWVGQSGEMLLLDWDRGRDLGRPATPVERSHGVYRFRRSLEIIADWKELFDAFLSGYGRFDSAWRVERMWALKRALLPRQGRMEQRP
ncbi:MAG TPA: lipopolysaccharide kinase InaA family protein [Candidatus Hydrogenedentes bacterium]|nr:lipopolysaccharide kinase InaA family protein [Candidatus Hydrogenedentota bacterium]